MSRRRYTPGMEYGQGSKVKEFVAYVAAMTDQQQEQALFKTQQLILQAIRRDVIKREMECLEPYFVQGYNYKQIGQALNYARELLATNNSATKEGNND